MVICCNGRPKLTFLEAIHFQSGITLQKSVSKVPNEKIPHLDMFHLTLGFDY